MFTGHYPYQHGSRYNGVPITEDIPVLAEILANYGYTSYAFVASAAVKGKSTGLDRGFTFYDDDFYLFRLNPHWLHIFPFKIVIIYTMFLKK